MKCLYQRSNIDGNTYAGYVPDEITALVADGDEVKELTEEMFNLLLKSDPVSITLGPNLVRCWIFTVSLT